MNSVRQPAVAGLFYPGNAQELSSEINQYLLEAENDTERLQGLSPKALIVPHAGYIYSGQTAAKAYATIADLADTIEKVILIGPAHRVRLRGAAITDVQFFRTPLGDVSIDTQSINHLSTLDYVNVLDEAHWQEHSLEVQIPFLQTVLNDFSLVPIIIGDATAAEVHNILKLLWGGPETLIVISSDLSHYNDYATAQYLDRTTCDAIEHFEPEKISFTQACGCIGVKGLLRIAKEKSMNVHTLQLCNSGDNTGDQERVVGYGSWAFTSR